MCISNTDGKVECEVLAGRKVGESDRLVTTLSQGGRVYLKFMLFIDPLRSFYPIWSASLRTGL